LASGSWQVCGSRIIVGRRGRLQRLPTSRRAANRHRGESHLSSAESARGISPRAAHRAGRESLDSSGSCHPGKAAALRQDNEFLRFPVDSISPRVTCPLRSTGITPLPRYYEAVRPWLAHWYFRPHGASACAFSLTIANQVLKFRTKAQTRVTPPVHRTSHGQ
jgi:hypothetical protein